MWKLCINFFVSHTVTRTDHSPAGSHTHQRRITFASEVSILLERAQSHSVSSEAVKLSHSLQSSAMARGESRFLIHCWLSTWQRLTWHYAMTLSGSCPWQLQCSRVQSRGAGWAPLSRSRKAAHDATTSCCLRCSLPNCRFFAQQVCTVQRASVKPVPSECLCNTWIQEYRVILAEEMTDTDTAFHDDDFFLVVDHANVGIGWRSKLSTRMSS